MEKDKIIIQENRGLISVSGFDSKDFLQNIITNDINKVSKNNSIFAAIFTPQGKYLYEFFIVQVEKEYMLDCAGGFTEEIIEHLSKYKLGSKIEIKNLSNKYVVGIISLDKFKEIQRIEKNDNESILFRDSPIYIDPRSKKLGARILSGLEKLHLTIKKLSLKIENNTKYLNKAHMNGIPINGIGSLKDKLFGLEANFEELNAIDFKKGCYVGQENTARMKLKNKIRRQLMSIKTERDLKIGDEIKYNDKIIGRILIDKPYPFALIKLFDPDFSVFKDKKLKINDSNVEIIS